MLKPPIDYLLRVSLSLLPACVALPAASQPKSDLPRVAATEPAAAQATFRTLNGFRMQLIAAEPIVTDPVAMTYDENGRAYVVEMNDYPYTDKATHQPWKDNTTDAPTGRVRLLEDLDGDGRFDRGTIFADKLSWPTGVTCWKGGVFVTATPDIWYLKDTDGDGSADVRRKVFTGFRKHNVQAVINNLVWGLDNWLCAAGATNGGNIIRADEPESKPIPMLRNVFRFDPRTEAFEVLSGGARFGNTFDDWGNRFLCNIRNPAQHVVIEHRYLKTNPHLPVVSAIQDVAESGDALPVHRISAPEAWRELRAQRWAGDRTVVTPRSELVAGGVVTSASGITIYRGSAYPPEYRGQFFLGEVANNLVHRQRLSPAGATFTSRRIDDAVEFAASTDVWFRPTNFVNAPDGTLHVLDMYREVIEHPWSIPDDIHDKLDLRSGSDRGRIYRLEPPGFKAPAPPRLGSASIPELIRALAHKSSWWRETAQRLIVERQDPAAIPLLRETLIGSDLPLARLHALWSLEGINALTEPDIIHALHDPEPGVRQNALRVTESRLAASPALRGRVIAMTNDMAPPVRFQVALTLALMPTAEHPRLAGALHRILRRDLADRWTRTAVLISGATRSDELLSRILSDDVLRASADAATAMRQLAAIIGARNQPRELQSSLKAISSNVSAETRTLVLEGLGDGLRHAGRTLRGIARDADPESSRLVIDVLDAAARTSADESQPLPRRLQSIRILAHDDYERVRQVLPNLLVARQPQEVQRAAVSALGSFNQPDVAPLLLQNWRAHSPAVRSDVIAAMFSFKNRLLPLLDAIESNRVASAHVPASRRTLLIQHADQEIRSRAIRIWDAETASGSTSRKAVIEQYRSALQLKGDAISGRKVFDAACIACHRVGSSPNDPGKEIGPNLATVRSWTAEQLLVNILDPNREVAPNYIEYVLELEGGESVSGIIADETAGSFRLVGAGGEHRVILRQNIRRMFSAGVSLMPESLENGLSPQQIADLIEYIRHP